MKLVISVLEVKSENKKKAKILEVNFMGVNRRASYGLTLIGLVLNREEVEDQRSRPRPRSQKNPRPRTKFLRTNPLEAQDRIGRGRGKGHNFSKL